MFTSIRTLATATLIAAIGASASSAGSFTPGTSSDHFVDADAGVSYLEPFKGGELAQVEITGDGGSDIDLYVYDLEGNLIARSISYGHVEYVEFTPSETADFEIRIENFGTEKGSSFAIWTN